MLDVEPGGATPLGRALEPLRSFERDESWDGDSDLIGKKADGDSFSIDWEAGTSSDWPLWEE